MKSGPSVFVANLGAVLGAEQVTTGRIDLVGNTRTVKGAAFQLTGEARFYPLSPLGQRPARSDRSVSENATQPGASGRKGDGSIPDGEEAAVGFEDVSPPSRPASPSVEKSDRPHPEKAGFVSRQGIRYEYPADLFDMFR